MRFLNAVLVRLGLSILIDTYVCMYICMYHRSSIGQVSRDDADEIAAGLVRELLHLRAERHRHFVRMHRLCSHMYVCIYGTYIVYVLYYVCMYAWKNGSMYVYAYIYLCINGMYIAY